MNRRFSAAAALAIATSVGMPPLGQQQRIQERQNVAGERLVPTPPKKRKPKQKTAAELATIAAAAAKRARKSALLEAHWTGRRLA